MANSKAEESPLSSVLNRDERGHLVVLIGSITANIRSEAAKAINNPQQSLSKKWLDQWQEQVVKRVSEASNTRWEPLKTRKPKDWDELSWDDQQETHKLEIDTSLHHLYPPIPTPLAGLEKKKRLLLMHSVLLILLSLEQYYAPSRLLLVHLASSLNLPLDVLNKDEEETASTLMTAAKEMSAQEEVDKKVKDNQTARRWKVGLASVAGAAVIGLTGGLAAPFVAAGLGTVLGGLGLGATAAAGLLGSLAGSSVLVGGLFGAYGARMTSNMVDQYAREVSDFKFVPARSGDERRLRVTIAVSGWLNEQHEVISPWKVVGPSTEVFGLRWELDTLMNLGSGLKEMVTSTAWNIAKMEILKRTVFASLLGALTLPLGLIKLGSLVDNPFRVATSRADKAGEVLADALINRAQGERPVALLGYSLGARVIQSCLLSLQKRKAYGLIDSVILIGAPIPNDRRMWQAMRTVVSGRFVNVYSENDYVLGFLYRANSAQVGIAGLSKVEAIGIENKDVSDIVDGHMRYKVLVGRILNEVGWEDLDADELMREHEALKELEAEEAEAMRQAEAKKASSGQEKDELIADMETQGAVERPSSASPPPMPPRPGSQSPPVAAQFGSLNISDAPPVARKQVSRPNARDLQSSAQPQQKSQADQPLIDLLGDGQQQGQTLNHPTLQETLKPTSRDTSSKPSDSTAHPLSPVDREDKTSTQPAAANSQQAYNIQRRPAGLANDLPTREDASKPKSNTDQLIPADPVHTSKAQDKDNDSEDESDGEPKFQGIQMVDNDPNLL